MLGLGAICILTFWVTTTQWRPAECKGVISFGKKGNTRQQPIDTRKSDEDESTFRFALWTPTVHVPIPNEKFTKFSRQAIEVRLLGYGQRSYYVLPNGVTYDNALLSDSNVCYSSVKAWKLTSSNFLNASSESWVTVHFLCDQYCCGADCCDLNVMFLVCLMFIAILLLFFCLWLCCRYGKWRFARIKMLQELTVANIMDSQQPLYESPSLDTDRDSVERTILNEASPC